jgi:hypothetical protein
MNSPALTVEDNPQSLRSLLEELWAFVDTKPLLEGSVGPLNRDSLYERGVSWQQTSNYL